MFGFQTTSPSSRGMVTKALPFHFTAGHLNVGNNEFAIGSGSNSACADRHLTYRLNGSQIKYQFYSTDGKSSDSNSPKYKSKSKDVY